MSTCLCLSPLSVHLPISGIVACIIEYCHNLSFKFFQNFIKSTKFFTSIDHEGCEINGKRIGSYYIATSRRLPSLRVMFRDKHIELSELSWVHGAEYKSLYWK
jgi:hypothetical protein